MIGAACIADRNGCDAQVLERLQPLLENGSHRVVVLQVYAANFSATVIEVKIAGEIGMGLAIMGVPLALPLASLVFLGAFIPLVGAVIAGFFAVVVALIAKGFVYALITLGLIIAVQQLEGHVLQPLVMGRAVSIHPLAVVLAIAGGGVLAGIVGALLAVPTVAFLNSAVRVLLAREPAAEEAAMEAESGPVVKGEADDVEATSD